MTDNQLTHAELDRLELHLRRMTEWVQGALNCETWGWDADQREWCEKQLAEALAALNRPSTEEGELREAAQRLAEAEKEFRRYGLNCGDRTLQALAGWQAASKAVVAALQKDQSRG